MVDHPEVSVVIPYGPEFTSSSSLNRAKQSAIDQSVPTDLIVIEDAESRGPAWARNRGIERAEARYVAFLDADDTWHDGKLRQQLARMDVTGAGLCVEGTDMETEAFMRELYLGNLESLTSSVLIDTHQVEVTFDESLERREDHLFMLEAAAQGGVCLVPDLFDVGRFEQSFSHGTTRRYRLRKDVEFAAKVRETVPEVRTYVNEFYSRPRCRVDPVSNTPGDVFRLILVRASLLEICLFPVSLVCQRLRKAYASAA